MADARIAQLERLTEQQRYLEVMELAPPLLTERSRGLRAYGHFFLGQALNRLFKPEQAIDHLIQARALFEALDEPWLAAESMEWEAGARYLKEDASALAMAKEALRRYRALEPRAAEVESRMLEHLGTILVRHQDYLQARDRYEEALDVAGRRLDISRLARIYHGLGSCHASLGDVQRAIELTSRAVTLYQVENDIRPQAARVDLPRAEGDLGVWYMSQGDLVRAEELLRAALDHLAESGVERLRSRGLLSLATLRQAQRRLDEALGLIEEAAALAERLGEQIALAMAHQQLGEVHAVRGAHDLVDESFERALAILEQDGLEERRAQCAAAYERVRESRWQASKG
ncbi:MAG: tetratricopeptide repeat protein [Chloroflexi bacterium]|nr:MAG: tetratricopeptide repeat protein [Chloroflexota bacterium]